MGEPVLFCPRKPKTATMAMPVSRKIRKKPRSILVFVDYRYVLAAALFEKFARLEFGKAGILGQVLEIGIVAGLEAKCRINPNGGIKMAQ